MSIEYKYKVTQNKNPKDRKKPKQTRTPALNLVNGVWFSGRATIYRNTFICIVSNNFSTFFMYTHDKKQLKNKKGI